MKKRNVIILMISLSLVLLLGSSYAYLRNVQVGNTPYVINVGTLQVSFEEGTEKLNLTNMYPMSDKEGSEQKELEFTINNIGTVASYYDVYIEETSTTPEFKTVIRYISNKENKGYNAPKTLSDNKYIDVGGYLESGGSVNYKLKVWLAEEAGNEYMNKEFKAKIVVKGMQESNYAKDVLKKVLVPYEKSSKEDFEGGLVAVNTNGDLYNEIEESQEIREYRYSGLNVDNYVTFNNEEWRIVGIFKDETGAEHLKLVKNEVLARSMFPDTYKIGDITYNIKNEDSAYWNRKADGTGNNDWATAGLQYWLNTKQDETVEKPNDGYLSHLQTEAIDMIEETRYYLGTVTYEDSTDSGVKDTPKEAYVNERKVDCTEGPAENNSKDAVESNDTCRVWSGNQAIWEGKVGLLYSSDIGYSTESTHWDKMMKYSVFGSFGSFQSSETSWLDKQANHSVYEWLLSPVSSHAAHVAYWGAAGHVTIRIVNHKKEGHFRPVINLKSNVEISGGTGEETNPYTLILN